MTTFSEISLCALTREYKSAEVVAVDRVSMRFRSGEAVAVMGPSGSGKSTLLQLLGGLDRPTAGEVLYDGVSLSAIADIPRFRAQRLGFVFQFHHLLGSMTLLENVEAPLLSQSQKKAERRSRALACLERCDLVHRASFLPSAVSGGERQRCSVARALVNHPALVLADEPTGALDSKNGQRVTELLVEQARERGSIVVIATHNPEVAARCDRIVTLRDGRVEA